MAEIEKKDYTNAKLNIQVKLLSFLVRCELLLQE